MEVSIVNATVDTFFPQTTQLALVNMIMCLSNRILLILLSLDVNECLVATDNNCSQICVNTNGTFQCQCKSGYILSSDNSTCKGLQIWHPYTVFHINYFPDVNECLIATDNNCSQLCINANGSFQCQCNSGYILSLDNTTCFGKNDNVIVLFNITHITFLRCKWMPSCNW